jgi:ribonuclease E
MSKIMLVNVTHVEESRVAILEDGVLAAYEIETINRTSIKGNIYNAVVETVHPGLEAAFVHISPGQKGFLPLDEVNFRLLPSREDSRARGRIGQHLQPGQRIMAQVVREPFAEKPPTISTYFSLPGRYLVLMPGVDTSAISRRIGDAQRDKIKQLVDDLTVPEGFGIIVRTAGIGRTKTELQRDLRYLLRLWQAIQKGSGASPFPGPVYRERDLVIRTIRDHYTTDISEVWIDSEETYNKALEFMKDVMPTRAKTLRLYSGDRPLFNKYNLEEQIETIYLRQVPLPSGGQIVIDGTEALTAIDVNSARMKRKMDAEDNATQTNLEAATEIARQFRLRDLGGLVVIDFIDMANLRNRKQVEKTIRDAMKSDKAKYDITSISKLGLMEIARQRLKGEKMGASYKTCPSCDGHGLIKNIEAAALAALRKIQTRSARGGFGSLEVSLPMEVATWILNNKRREILVLEDRHTIQIVVQGKTNLLRHESDFQTREAEPKVEPSSVSADGQVAAARPTPASPAATPTAPPAASASASAAAPVSASTSSAAASTQDPASQQSGPAPAAEERKPSRRRRRSRRKPQDPEQIEPAKAQPQADSEEQSAPSESEGSPEPAQEGDTPPRKRRRRKRRRRPRSSENTGQDQPKNEDRDNQPENNDSPAPKTVIVNELMPAAVGEADGQRSSSGRPGSRRKNRG